MAERSASSLQQVDDDHDAHHLTYAMMLGIRTAVGAIEAKPPRRLLEGDFEEKIKVGGRRGREDVEVHVWLADVV